MNENSAIKVVNTGEENYNEERSDKEVKCSQRCCYSEKDMTLQEWIRRQCICYLIKLGHQLERKNTSNN